MSKNCEYFEKHIKKFSKSFREIFMTFRGGKLWVKSKKNLNEMFKNLKSVSRKLEENFYLIILKIFGKFWVKWMKILKKEN